MKKYRLRMRKLGERSSKWKKVMGKVYRVSTKHGRARMYFHSLICEAAGLKPSDTLYIYVDEEKEEIILQNHVADSADKTITVSRKKCRTSGELRPIVDTSGDLYTGVLAIQQKIQVSVYKQGNKSRIIVRPLRFNYLEQDVITTKDVQYDQRIKLSTYGAGAGISTAAMIDTQYFTAVQEFEIEEDSASVLHFNFPNSCLENADIRDVNEVLETDVALVTLKCNEHSHLGHHQGGVFDNVVLHVAQLIKSSGAKLILIENVGQFYSSRHYQLFTSILQDQFPYWKKESIESYDYGSIARRNRTYACGFRCKEDYMNFQFPAAPASIRRKKLRDYLDPKGTVFEWKSLDSWKESFSSKAEKGNAWKDRNVDKTFVTPEVREIYCIPKRYRSQSASNTYVLSECKTKWRFLTVSEIRRILAVPEWFQFPPSIPNYRKNEMLGQSVDCNIIRAIGNELATVFYKAINRVTRTVKESVPGLIQDTIRSYEDILEFAPNGQLRLTF
ncbi:DNA cytosine methyltransferase [Brevibacillus sp. NPDC003359]|uniref:DNA cytosine methyltransferase n=1 Tax=unclassified Brevibacillus TaxID=2684853 RepID=UPI0036A7CDED